MKKTILMVLIGLAFCMNALAQQGRSDLQIADSLYTMKQWKSAREHYQHYLKDTSTNAIAWNRMGYSNQNLGLYEEALKDYQKSLANKPSPPLKSDLFPYSKDLFAYE